MVDVREGKLAAAGVYEGRGTNEREIPRRKQGGWSPRQFSGGGIRNYSVDED
jgi:hypothetical protein